MLNLEQALKTKRILVLDDLVEARSSLKKMMTMLGAAQIDSATNGAEASQLIMEHDYDLVLSDYNLGKGKDGQQVLEEARYCNRLRATALFILVTGENALDMVMGALEYEPDNYITKPFTLSMLKERLIRILTTKEQLREIDLAIDAGDNDHAIALALTMKASKPRLLIPLTRILGKLYLRQKRYQEAFDVYSALLEQRSVAWARLGQAICMHFLGNSRSALALLEQTLLAHPRYVQCYDWSAAILLSMGQPQNAQKQLQKAVEISPKAVLRQMELGRIASDNQDFAVATEAFDQAVRLGRHSCYKTATNYLRFTDSVQQQLANASDEERASRELRQLTDKAFKAMAELREDYANQPDILFAASLSESRTLLTLHQEQQARDAALQAEATLLQMKNPGVDAQLQLSELFIQTGQHLKAKDTLQRLKTHQPPAPVLARIATLEQNLDEMAIRDHTAQLNADGIKRYSQKDFAAAVAIFDAAAAYEEAGISVLLNAIQAKISLVESQGDRGTHMQDCQNYFRRIGTIGSSDERYERYERLRTTFERLKRQ